MGTGIVQVPNWEPLIDDEMSDGKCPISRILFSLQIDVPDEGFPHERRVALSVKVYASRKGSAIWYESYSNHRSSHNFSRLVPKMKYFIIVTPNVFEVQEVVKDDPINPEMKQVYRYIQKPGNSSPDIYLVEHINVENEEFVPNWEELAGMIYSPDNESSVLAQDMIKEFHKQNRNDSRSVEKT